ncbi:glycosyltransferase family 4 protein [Halobacillus hunanensis]|uniref:glycosyltransferase family 4 protein n=1 Tax=Halobacillus hunanensis TaxID=578214 RepID=UPI0009A6A8E9|nr:glycosyltransferase family 4 protein [Halobacillus hunanensis]
MKILIMKAYYKPEVTSSSYLTENLLQALCQHGIEVDLIVPTPTRGISKEVRKDYKSRKKEVLYDGKLNIYRFNLFNERRSIPLRVIRYLLSNLLYFLKGLKAKDIDLIHVSSTPPTMGVVAALLKKVKKVPVVISIQDVFPDSLVSSGITHNNSLLYRLGRKIEEFTYENSDKIIVISEDFKSNLLSKGVSGEKIHVIYNWVEQNSIVPIKRKDNMLVEKLGLDIDKFYVVYAGNLGHAQNVEILIQAANRLRDNVHIEFLIFGNGVLEEEIKKKINDLELENIKLYPLLPYSMVSHVYSLGDVSIVSCKKGFGGSAMPSKTWSIMSCGRPVLASFDSGTELENTLKKNNLGLFSEAEDLDSLVNNVYQLYKKNHLATEMGKNGREFILNNLTSENGTSEYINTFWKAVMKKNV